MMPFAAGPYPKSTTVPWASLVEVTTVTGACCRRTGPGAYPTGIRVTSHDRSLRPSYHAGGGRAGADDRHRDEIELVELVEQRLCRILRPRQHAGP